jgi:hypothetical protein
MNGVGYLLIGLIFFFVGLKSIIPFIRALNAESSKKPKLLLKSAIWFLVLCWLKLGKDKSYQRDQMHEIGIYYLTNYPDCDSCYVELKEDMTYNLVKNDTIIETSDWHFESGGDYWILHMDKDKKQLGSGEFGYKKYKLKYPQE